MQSEPQAEHKWLDQLQGEWTFENQCSMGPDQPPMQFTGKETVRSLGGLWVICEGEGEMPGGGVGYMRMTLGYDPNKKRYVGSWVGSMMTHQWVYEGEVSADGKTLVLDTRGPSMAGDGSMADYQDIISIVGPNERTLSSQFKKEDGTWQKFMTSTYRKK